MSERKKIWSNITLFLLPIALVITIVFIVPANERFNYYFPKYNCMGKSGWIYDRLHNDEHPADIVFLGSSRTIDGIGDKYIEDSLQQLGGEMNVLNLGYCRFGRNMHYILAKRAIEKWKPKCIVIEVTAKENWDGHPDFGYMATNQELFAPVMIFNDNYLQDIGNALTARFDNLRSNWFGVNDLPPVNTEVYGHKLDTTHVSPNVLIEQKEKRMTQMIRTKGLARWFYYQYPLSYLDKTVALLQENNCEVVFLYLPAYGSWEHPQEYEWYKKRGTLLIPPKSIYENRFFWKDGNHMNDHGARSMAGWLAKELAAVIQ